jgi:hypothetical protein
VATDTLSLVGEIGETAGAVWRQLEAHGPQTLPKLVKDLDLPRDLVMQALGWLAREDKIVLEDGPRSRIVGLR